MLIAMRLLLASALIAACASILVDQIGAGPDTLACRSALCRKDQLFRQRIGQQPAMQANDLLLLRRLVQLAPADAYAWAGLAEQLRTSGELGEGRRALDHAVELAPTVAQIRMRRVNLCFENREESCLLRDGRIVLSKTAVYDAVLFSYYTTLGIRLSDILSLGLPDDARSSRAWAIYLARSALSIGDTLSTWGWLKNHGYADVLTVCQMTRELVNRREFGTAWRVWRDFRAQEHRPNNASNLITNSAFERPSAPTPFDWELRQEPGVHFNQGDGLEVVFEGTENLSLRNVRQLSYLEPGPHRMIVDLEYEGLTTDQGPYVRLAGGDHRGAWSVQTIMFKGTAPRFQIQKDFVVPVEAGPVWIQVERKPSEKFENRIAGRLKLHAISLFALSGNDR